MDAIRIFRMWKGSDMDVRVIWMRCGYSGCGGEWGCDMDVQDFTRTLINLNF